MPNSCPKCGLGEDHIERVNKAKKNFPNIKEINGMSDFYKVMGDETRLKLLMSLEAAGKLCVSDLSCLLNMSLSAVSHRLKVLRLNKLVKSTRDGKIIYYELDDDHVKSILEIALEHIKEENE